MKIAPLGDKVIVVDDPVKKKTKGGILLPLKAQTSVKATVIAVGPGKFLGNGKRHVLSVKVGDRVLASKGGLPIEQDGQKARLVDIQDIIAVE